MSLTAEQVRKIVPEMQAANNVEFVAGLKVEMDEMKTKIPESIAGKLAR